MKRKPPAALPPGYGQIIVEIKGQKAEGWGAKIIDRLSQDLQNEFPGQQGFSPRNLKYMRAFAEAWPETAMVHQPDSQPNDSNPTKSGVVPATLAQIAEPVPVIVHQPGAQLPWKHQCLLLDKLDQPAERLWYAAKAVEQGWSRDMLALQIGLILCRAKNRIIAEYALRDLHKPIGVSDYVTRLVASLPKEIQGSVPSVKEIESGIAPAAKPIGPRKSVTRPARKQ
jgi:predicted nuclease of restriction endonuclease-like (RecB) superfamily